jgi:hypothetical protein
MGFSARVFGDKISTVYLLDGSKIDCPIGQNSILGQY